MLRRLDRIDALEREGAHPPALLAELRALVREAEAWARADGPSQQAVEAIGRCKEVLRGPIIAA